MGQQSSKSGSKKAPSKSTAVVKGMPSGYMTSNQLRPGTVKSAPVSTKSTRKKKGGKCKRKCCKSKTKRR